MINNMEKDLIKYKWRHGIYSIEEMLKLVENNEITIEEFEDITGKSYKGIKKERKLSGKT